MADAPEAVLVDDEVPTPRAAALTRGWSTRVGTARASAARLLSLFPSSRAMSRVLPAVAAVAPVPSGRRLHKGLPDQVS